LNIRCLSMLTAALLCCWSCSVYLVTAIRRTDLFPYGTLHGDAILPEGDDETSRALTLPRPLYFFDSSFSQLYVATNGIISAQDLPMEQQYVDDGLPTDFPVVAPFLADIDTSGGRGHIYYRVTGTPGILNREVNRGFPDAKFTPTHAVVATWENVAAYEDQARAAGPSNKVNTFQAVIGYDETDSYVLFLYPEDGLTFFGTRPKESYNVEIELPARVGFSRGEVSYFIISKTDGPFYSVTQDEDSVKRLSQVGNTGIAGVWLFHTGRRYFFQDIIPASTGGLLVIPPTVGYSPYLVILLLGVYNSLFSTIVIQYTTENKETCARFQRQCSQNAFCSDYPTGFCCHCQTGFYGNGRQCLPDGAPQPVSGKVSGTVTVGSTPFELNNIDLHAYIVVGDGRAYTAISEVPESLGWPMMSVSPIGELFGWLFALELPNSQAGFKITGAEFSRHAEVLFNPGNQRLSIIQTGRGLDEHNHLSVDTAINGNVPYIPPGAEVTMEPFKETYQYYPSVTTSSSVRRFSVVSAERGAESYTFHLKQNITYRDCRHNSQAATPETLQINMERVFLLNPCYTGSHDCDTTAQCIPLEGQAFRCQCATGYRGDGQNCNDIDECAEGLSSCGEHSQCLNLPGTHRCQCQSGFESSYDGHTCVDIDECSSSPCHINARCINDLGSFQCQCLPEYYGDGFQCSPRSGCQCEQHRERLQSEGQTSVGAYIPQCDSDGQYQPRQCHGSTGQCWCVDSRGEERPGTRTPPGAAPVEYCDKPERPKTRCEHHRDGVQNSGSDGLPPIGAYIPQCDENGQYLPEQCHGSTGHCWCVDSIGQERLGTRTPPGSLRVDCSEPERPKTHCELHRDSFLASGPDGRPLVVAYVPQCDENGQYLPEQCDGSTGYCWCVDERGQELAETRTPPGTPRMNCNEPQRPKTHCEHYRDSVQTSSPDGLPPVGAYVPQCDENGQYLPEQCDYSSGHCWCVDSQGQERGGTRTPPGSPRVDCNEPQRPKTHCEHYRDSVQTSGPDGLPPLGAYVPQCDESGQYLPQQCQPSTGYCWCVNKDGEEREGTRTPPGTQPKDCTKPVFVPPSNSRVESVCERWRASLIEQYGGKPDPQQYLPQCEPDGEFSPVQCYGESTYCWCVNKEGQEITGTRSHDAVKPACLPTVAPPVVRPVTRPDVTPPANTDVTLLYAQGQKIGALPLNGTRLDAARSSTLLTLHGSIVVGIAYDCKENKVYWTDLSARTINRASVASGAEPEILISTGLFSPEGLAVDTKRRLMFWVDSNTDVIESADLDGSGRRTLFDLDLVNPRAIIVVSSTGSLYWTDWNREAPKIETSTVDGQGRRVVVSDGVGLPNALTYDSSSGQICWADAGTKRLECISPNGSGRRVISSGLNYPFSMVYYSNHFYYSDWRRDGVIAVSKDSSKFTDEYLPEQRSHLYGITIATSHCLPGKIKVTSYLQID
uniref:Nidogen 2a (osteonidogen) n=1 Tax=Cyprinodon variegatus TaxID=28743 RepID=A0A3Q2CM74_CYPVA